jgi:formamidopyrimidine-DNA glycosylase
VNRRGKYLWFAFDSGDALLAHLGMSGQFVFNAADDPLARSTRVLFDFTDGGSQLRFIDQRMFGGLEFVPGGAALPPQVAHIALDPLDPAFDLKTVAKQIHSRNTTIKRALLNQSLISGIGNIYADESLWAARVHYDTPTRSMPVKRIEALLVEVQRVLRAAIEAGGTSFDALYVDTDGSSGYFSRQLNAYGREGLPCPRCGRPIAREHFMNRSSFRCTKCQPRPRG